LPKKRKKPGSRPIEKKLLIFCEGKKDKSESAYFKALIKDYKFPGNKIDVRVVDTRINTGKELVKLAKSEQEFPGDKLWVVYDKDGYTQHAQTFDAAKRSNIQIAFSSVSFEFWILLHFEYTSRAYSKSDDIIHDLKHKHDFDYSKADKNLYSLTKNNIQKAKNGAMRIQKHQRNSCTHSKIYRFNPYTNINELILDIEKLLEKE
jgi:hypothetical protein